MDFFTALFQIGLSAALGAFIGIEREHLHKAAGYRTLSLVAIGVTLFTLISQHGFEAEGVVIDPTRIAAQVVTGIGFLGAGLIIFHNEKIQNLTTAAAIWVVAAIAMAVGVGWYGIAIATAIVVFLVLFILRKLFRSHG